MIERHFGPIPANATLPAPPDMTVDAAARAARCARRCRTRCRCRAIYLAHRIPPFGTDAFDALDVAADILGAGRASRLYASLVREQRLAQDASVFVFPVVGGASMFALWVTARPGVSPETLEAATLAEIDRLAADGPSDADLERVKNLHAAHAAGGARADQRTRAIGSACTPASSTSRSASTPSRPAGTAVDAERVSEALRASLRPDNRVTLTYVPAEAAS